MLSFSCHVPGGAAALRGDLTIDEDYKANVGEEFGAFSRASDLLSPAFFNVLINWIEVIDTRPDSMFLLNLSRIDSGSQEHYLATG